MYTVSKHAQERYAERILSFTDKAKINEYIANNRDKINSDLNDMIKYGELIYSGKPIKKEYGVNRIHEVYIRHNWIIIADRDSKNIITIYAVTLGLGKEFDIDYCNKMVAKIHDLEFAVKSDLELNSISISGIDKKLSELRSCIESYTRDIKQMQGSIETLEASKREMQQSNAELQKEIRDTVAKLTGSRIF